MSPAGRRCAPQRRLHGHDRPTVKLVRVVPDVVARRGALEPQLSDSMSRLAEVGFIVSLPPLGICLGVAAVVVLVTHVFPAWLGYLAAGSAPLLIADGFALDREFGPAFMLFLLWVLLAGICVASRRGRRLAAPGAADARRLVS